MSDRTQTLLVELAREHVRALAGESFPGASEYERSGRAVLRSALSRPEHQGDEETDRARADRLEIECRELEDANRSLAKMRDKALEGNLAAAQPSAPVLSDEERAELRRIADIIGGVHRPCADPELHEDDAHFLRNLASQEHRGEETITVERARMQLREAFETSEWPQDGTDLEYFTRRALPAREEADEIPHYIDLDKDDLRAGARNIRPPAGEVERLRERIRAEIEHLRDSAIAAEAVAASDVELDDDPTTGARANRRTADRLQALLNAAPSDSQGDQEREATGLFKVALSLRDAAQGYIESEQNFAAGRLPLGIFVERQRAFGRALDAAIPDCNPVPTQVEGDDDCYLCFNCGEITPSSQWTLWQREEGVLRPHRHDESDALVKCPRCGEVHGDGYQGAGYEDGTKAHLEGEKKHLLAKDLEFFVGAPAQPEGGDEEDWREQDEVGALSKAADEIDHLEEGRLKDWAALLLALEADGWRVVPATSQPGTLAGLRLRGDEDVVDVERALALCTHLPAAVPSDPSELARCQDAANYWHAKALSESDRAVRAEAALEELAAEFERCADKAEGEWQQEKTPNPGYLPRGEMRGLRKAQELAREKAAKLKEGR